MNVVMLSGGSGMRLWPLSNESRSKQFLKVLKDEKNKKQSMVQRVHSQLKKSGCDENILIATNANQADSIRIQLGQEINIVVEPERRNTFPAIALAVSKLYFKENCDREDVVVVLPVDPFAESLYFELLKNLEIVVQSGVDIALMGVTPTYPSEKYGYIVPQNNSLQTEQEITYKKVSRFKEKPTEQEADSLIQNEGALWNCGVFAFKVGYILDILSKSISFNSFEDVLTSYGKLKSTSFDYEIVEKADSIAVVEYNGVWKDLGTWNTLCEHMTQPIMGNVVLSETSENAHVINELEIPMVVIGMKDAVIVATHDGILVSDKHESSYLKNYLYDNVMRPMSEKRRWGSYKVLDLVTNSDGEQVLTKKMKIKEEANFSYQYHYKRSEVWTIIEGNGLFIQDDEIKKVAAGDVLIIPIGSKHSLKALSELSMIEVQIGSELVEEDIFRIEKKWDKILEMMVLGKMEKVDE